MYSHGTSNTTHEAEHSTLVVITQLAGDLESAFWGRIVNKAGHKIPLHKGTPESKVKPTSGEYPLDRSTPDLKRLQYPVPGSYKTPPT